MKRFLILVAIVWAATPLVATADDSAAESLGVMYWTDRTAGIYRAARDGSEIQLIVRQTPVDQMIYWTYPGGDLYRAKLDGSERQKLAGGLNQPDGVAIDVDNRKLYWAEKGKVSQANLDGSAIEQLVTGRSDLYSSMEILPPKEP